MKSSFIYLVKTGIKLLVTKIAISLNICQKPLSTLIRTKIYFYTYSWYFSFANQYFGTPAARVPLTNRSSGVLISFQVREALLVRHRHQHERRKDNNMSKLPIIRSLAEIGRNHSSSKSKFHVTSSSQYR